ncbi:Uncharacterised protein [Vibrio cholerae]|nr:Uncharacterised protein [Vibrio cholerae]CSI33371.1 Uncharacterised protein [Vibrio cholerae]
MVDVVSEAFDRLQNLDVLCRQNVTFDLCDHGHLFYQGLNRHHDLNA